MSQKTSWDTWKKNPQQHKLYGAPGQQAYEKISLHYRLTSEKWGKLGNKQSNLTPEGTRKRTTNKAKSE